MNERELLRARAGVHLTFLNRGSTRKKLDRPKAVSSHAACASAGRRSLAIASQDPGEFTVKRHRGEPGHTRNTRDTRITSGVNVSVNVCLGDFRTTQNSGAQAGASPGGRAYMTTGCV